MKKLFVTFFFVVGILFSSMNAVGEQLNFVTMEWPPMIIINQEGKLIGTGIETVEAMCKRMEIEPKIKILPWKRAITYMKKGIADVLIAPKKNEERMGFMYFSDEPMYIERVVLIAPKNKIIKAKQLEDLKNKSIGAVRGYYYCPEFDNHKGLKKIICDTDKQMLKILDKGRIDLGIGEEGNLKWLAKELGLKDYFETVYILSEEPNYLAFSKKALGERGKTLAEKFSEALIQLKKEGEIEKIEKKYF